jgi:hypothetical protein
MAKVPQKHKRFYMLHWLVAEYVFSDNGGSLPSHFALLASAVGAAALALRGRLLGAAVVSATGFALYVATPAAGPMPLSHGLVRQKSDRVIYRYAKEEALRKQFFLEEKDRIKLLRNVRADVDFLRF